MLVLHDTACSTCTYFCSNVLVCMYKLHVEAMMCLSMNLWVIVSVTLWHFLGLNKHFCMASISERLNAATNKCISSEHIWKHLSTMYDLKALVSYSWRIFLVYRYNIYYIAVLVLNFMLFSVCSRVLQFLTLHISFFTWFLAGNCHYLSKVAFYRRVCINKKTLILWLTVFNHLRSKRLFSGFLRLDRGVKSRVLWNYSWKVEPIYLGFFWW